MWKCAARNVQVPNLKFRSRERTNNAAHQIKSVPAECHLNTYCMPTEYQHHTNNVPSKHQQSTSRSGVLCWWFSLRTNQNIPKHLWNPWVNNWGRSNALFSFKIAFHQCIRYPLDKHKRSYIYVYICIKISINTLYNYFVNTHTIFC